MRLLLLGFVGGLTIFILVTGEGPSSLLNRISVFLGGQDYALDIFSEQVPVARVVASKGSYSRDPLDPKCSVAIVELAVDAPDVPPKVPLMAQADTRFGGRWVATPEARKFAPGSDLLEVCAEYIWHPARRDLESALAETGAFVIRDWKNNVLQIYAPNRRLAAHLHFGLALD
jgi:hypothetical protein